jgi:tRNA G18 (ribose-2'-O)-methylase SpoU
VPSAACSCSSHGSRSSPIVLPASSVADMAQTITSLNGSAAVVPASVLAGGVVLLPKRVQSLAQVAPGDHLCWVALTHVRSPGNLGTLMRTSAAVGAGGFILLGGVDPFDPAVVRGSMGGLFRQQLVRAGTACWWLAPRPTARWTTTTCPTPARPC